jgi:methionyl-tRNA formyltransferase
MKTRIVFMGSPEFAVPTLQALEENYYVVGVITQPDRPSGRGRKIQAPAIKILAEQLDLPIIQPERVKGTETLERIRNWEPDLIVVAAYGQILPPTLLELPPHGCVNVHASLLPRWRGAAPIQAAIQHGDQETGVTIMQMDAGMDTGPIIDQVSMPILAVDTAATLSERLAKLGAKALRGALPGYLSGELKPKIQDEALATMAPILSKSDGELDFSRSAHELERQVRAFNPWPSAFMIWKNQPLKVFKASPQATDTNFRPGTHTSTQGYPAVQTKAGMLILEEVQPAGKKRLPGNIFLRGAKDWESE